MANTSKKTYTQYSKKLTTAITIFWCVARLFALVATYINPECGSTINMIIKGLDDIEMIVVLSYTGNSVSEKIATSYFESKKQNPNYNDLDSEIGY